MVAPVLNVTVAVTYRSRIPVGSVDVAPGKTLTGALNGVTGKVRSWSVASFVSEDGIVPGPEQAMSVTASEAAANNVRTLIFFAFWAPNPRDGLRYGVSVTPAILPCVSMTRCKLNVAAANTAR